MPFPRPWAQLVLSYCDLTLETGDEGAKKPDGKNLFAFMDKPDSGGGGDSGKPVAFLRLCGFDGSATTLPHTLLRPMPASARIVLRICAC